MRILHTSDWHIGKKTENFERLPEQREVLDEIASVADAENVELIIVAGDVFDTFIPSAEAEQTFFDKIRLLSEKRPVVIIPGNHDDATRLCASSAFAGKNNVFFFENVNEDSNAPFVVNTPFRQIIRRQSLSAAAADTRFSKTIREKKRI